jgi:hypothetical protein
VFLLQPEAAMTTREPLPGNAAWWKNLLMIGAVLGGFCMIVGGADLFRTMAQEQRNQELLRTINRIDQEGDFRDLEKLRQMAVAAPGVAVPFDDLHYAALHDRWRQTLRQFDQLMAARDNRHLVATLPEFTNKVRQGLLDLRVECANYLQGRPEHSTPRATWKIYNLRGCLSTMAAYLFLEFDGDGRESSKLLNDAIEDFKVALQRADEEKATVLERMLPGWNLELVVGAGEVFAIGQEIMENNMLTVQEQLEPVLPNFGGYSPGAPLDIFVDK